MTGWRIRSRRRGLITALMMLMCRLLVNASVGLTLISLQIKIHPSPRCYEARAGRPSWVEPRVNAWRTDGGHVRSKGLWEKETAWVSRPRTLERFICPPLGLEAEEIPV